MTDPFPHVPFLEKARVQFGPLVISEGAEMSVSETMRALAEGVRDNMKDIDT